MAFAKSILRSLVDGGTQLSDERCLIDRLAEFSETTGTNRQLALYGGCGQILLGLLVAPTNLVGFFAIALGGYCLTKIKPNSLSNLDNRELLLLAKHRNMFGVLKRLKLRGVNDEEILQRFEAMISRYDFAGDQIILNPEHVIPASNAIAGFETVTTQICSHETIPPQSAPVQKRSFLAESLKPSRQLPGAIGQNTRLGAMTVVAEEVETQTATPGSEPLPAISPVDYLIGSRLRTSLVVSVSGGGKDFLLSNALRKFLGIYPGFGVIVMDCKDDSKEHAYYDGLPRVKVYRLNLTTANESTAAAWIDAALDEFNSRPEKTLLICNEGTLVRAVSKRYVDVVGSLVSSGDSREKYVWEGGQSGHTEDLRINSAARSRFRPLVIGMADEEMQVEAILRAKWLADSANNIQSCRSEMSRSPVGRAWSDGQRWYPMPKLENFAGYDRDSRTFLNPQQGASQTDVEIPQSNPPETDSQKPSDSNQKANVKKPEMPTKEIMLNAAELSEWIEQNGVTDAAEVYSKWQSRKHGFSRPEIRYLLTLITHDE